MFAAPNTWYEQWTASVFRGFALPLLSYSINCFLVSSLTKLQKLDLTFLLICKAPTALTSAPLLFRQGNVTFSLNISVVTLYLACRSLDLICRLLQLSLLREKSRFVMTYSLPPMSPVSPRCFPPKWRLSNAFGILTIHNFEVSFYSQIGHLWHGKTLLSLPTQTQSIRSYFSEFCTQS